MKLTFIKKNRNTNVLGIRNRSAEVLKDASSITVNILYTGKYLALLPSLTAGKFKTVRIPMSPIVYLKIQHGLGELKTGRNCLQE